MAVRSTTALRKYLTQRSNLGQPLREKAGSTTGGHVEGETLITSGAYRRPLFKSSLDTIVDGSIDQQPEVYFEGGDHSTLIHMSRAEFVRLDTTARHGSFTGPWSQA